jgi:hypothetical protein
MTGPAVYRVTGTISWAGRDQRATPGEVVIDPPAFVPEQLGRHLERIDVDGRLPRDELQSWRYQDLQRLAASGHVEELDGNSDGEAIVDAYALVEPEDDEEPDE